MDPDQKDQGPIFVRPDRNPNCLQMLSADDTSRQNSVAAELPLIF